MALPYLSDSTSPKGKREKAVGPPIVATDSLHYEKVSSVQLQCIVAERIGNLLLIYGVLSGQIFVDLLCLIVI